MFDIPDNWAWCRLKEIVTLTSGKPFEESEDGFLYVKVADMNLDGNEETISKSSHFCNAKKEETIPLNSIIFPKRGGAISTNKKRKILTNNVCVDLNTMAMTPFKKELFDYLFLWFSTIDLGRLSTGSSVPQINNVDIYPLLIPIPPLEEQKKITNKTLQILEKIKGD